jgi:SAM-dependent methyltransferase
MSDPYYKQHWIDIEPERHAAYDQILGYHPALEPIIRPLELKPGLRVLDVGSGPAYTTMELARRVAPSGRVSGVDINAEFIARSTERAREAKLPVEFTHSAFPAPVSIACSAKTFSSMSIPPPIPSSKWRA